MSTTQIMRQSEFKRKYDPEMGNIQNNTSMEKQ